MLDFGWSHIFLLMVVALVVVGPKDLPRLMRTVGQWMGKAREMANQFKRSFDDMARQSELDELRQEIDNLRHNNPLADMGRELHQAIVPDEMRSAVPPPGGVSVEAAPVEIETARLPEPGPEPRDGEFAMTVEPHIEPHTEPHAEPIVADGYKPPSP